MSDNLPRKPLFADLIAAHPNLREELADMDQPLTTPEMLQIAATAMEDSIGGQAACLRAVELTVERLAKGTTAQRVDGGHPT